jgi:uncharacterized DUF497 family protein
MAISFDLAKSAKNVLVRGILFESAALFEWVGALIVEDLRKDYGERRFQALGLIRIGCIWWYSRRAPTRCM